MAPGACTAQARQRRASSTPGAVSAPVGQAGRQARHAPQPGRSGSSGARAASVSTAPSTYQEPWPGSRIVVLLPYHPTPARAAAARSTRALSSARTTARCPAPRSTPAPAPRAGRRGKAPRRRRPQVAEGADHQAAGARQRPGGIARASGVAVGELHRAGEAGRLALLKGLARLGERLGRRDAHGGEAAVEARLPDPLAKGVVRHVWDERRRPSPTGVSTSTWGAPAVPAAARGRLGLGGGRRLAGGSPPADASGPSPPAGAADELASDPGTAGAGGAGERPGGRGALNRRGCSGGGGGAGSSAPTWASVEANRSSGVMLPAAKSTSHSAREGRRLWT